VLVLNRADEFVNHALGVDDKGSGVFVFDFSSHTEHHLPSGGNESAAAFGRTTVISNRHPAVPEAESGMQAVSLAREHSAPADTGHPTSSSHHNHNHRHHHHHHNHHSHAHAHGHSRSQSGSFRSFLHDLVHFNPDMRVLMTSRPALAVPHL